MSIPIYSTPKAKENILKMNQPQEKKIYTTEEIKKIAPGYRGKPERFDPSKVGRRAPQQQKRGPASKAVTPPTALDKAAKPTPPKNSPLWADSVFGIAVAVRELTVNQEICPTYARLPEIVEEVYSSIGGDDQNLNKQVTKCMLMYYTTAMLWTRLLDIKAKRGNANLSFEEQEFCKAIMQQEYNIPQPIYLFLKGIGEVKDVTGKTVYLTDHTLPVTVVQGFGGYHSAAIAAENHNLYEEIPSLGICGDIVMAESSEAAAPAPNFRVLPALTRVTRAMCGYFGPIGTRKEEVRILLNSVGVTATNFDEVIGGTRLNVHLIQKVSDYFAGSPTFRNEKVKLDALTVEGDAAQLIKSVPTDENVDVNARWTNLVIRPKSASANSTSTFGASYLMGYQLVKAAIAGSNANWCCVEQAAAANPWVISQAWINNMNERRNGDRKIRFYLRFSAKQDERHNQAHDHQSSLNTFDIDRGHGE